ncbi:unnamed protein product [Paramecium octaurelia]|uniref:Phosphoglycerate mutase n=1 Tax=Paramecium octaurelia TaxID=43137 RepID=A0A8S1VX07_PAROT|nr:unnamed protein product [Paramecium octaurelia]
MKKLVLIRHGESILNKTNSFGGWLDVDLSTKGIQEAQHAALLLQQNHHNFDVVHTSILKRSIKSANVMLETMNSLWVTQQSSWRLNERHYGILQGMNKKEASIKYGEEQIKQWRRSFSQKPPYSQDGNSESLEDVTIRVRPYWEDCIAKDINQNKQVLVVGHSNSLRALLCIIKKLSEQQLLELNIPTATPLVIQFNDRLQYQDEFYLGNQEQIKQKIKQVANQGSLKQNK